ncbi:hypothetical protein SAMN05660464_2044 [Geodermatophilus dictyosporus]|uniref:Vanillate O-demethylase oxygenase-like C-terminal catalytic domain-containing protein n=1 Tax=Geodermatophilus dictyosporus TaxID=1523247 RepID=A0A1I5MLP2_9ACTN|nr:hypothetical protein SAMN05660464_2044 [Geodermatophilus dictyosporus]
MPSTARSTGWFPVARAAEVGTTPLPVGAGGRARVGPGPGRTAVRLPPTPGSEPRPEAVPAPDPPSAPVFGDLHPSLEHAWHPVALSRELRPGGWLQVRLLGRTWALSRTPDGLSADPPAWGVRERLGLVWLAPAEPRDVPLELPEHGDRRFVTRWLTPSRSAGGAGPLADALLDVAHLPFVHGRAAATGVPAPEVTPEPGGFSSVTEHRRDGAPGSDEHRVATWTHRAPFRLRLRVEWPGSGAVTTRLVVLQPEDADSTRVYTCLLLSSGPGQPLPAPDAVAAEVAAAEQELAEDLSLLARAAAAGLPLGPRDELHVRADRPGVALRRALSAFARAATIR